MARVVARVAACSPPDTWVVAWPPWQGVRERVKLVKQLQGLVPPRVAQTLASLMQEAAHVNIGHGADTTALTAVATDHHLKYDIVKGVCGCRRSQISGMPCIHMCALARVAGRELGTTVHPCLTSDALTKTYAKAGPAQDIDLSHLRRGPLVAPKLKRRVGRPRKRPLAHAPSLRADKVRRSAAAGAGSAVSAAAAKAASGVVAASVTARPWQPSAVAAASAADAGRPVQPGARKKVPQRCSACGRTGHKRGTCGRDAQPHPTSMGVVVSVHSLPAVTAPATAGGGDGSVP